MLVDGVVKTLAQLSVASIDLTPSGSGRSFADVSAITGTTTLTLADGKTVTTRYDDDGDTIVERSQRRVVTSDAAGAVTETLSDYGADGSVRRETTRATKARPRTGAYVLSRGCAGASRRAMAA